MSKQDKEQAGVLLKEIAETMETYLKKDTIYLGYAKGFGLPLEPLAKELLAKAREAVKGAGLKLNRGGILSDVEVEYYNNGAEAQTQAILKAMGGE